MTTIPVFLQDFNGDPVLVDGSNEPIPAGYVSNSPTPDVVIWKQSILHPVRAFGSSLIEETYGVYGEMRSAVLASLL